jgi:hypothetical protein
MTEKICTGCAKDVSTVERTKDRKGRYWCMPCYKAALARHKARQAARRPEPEAAVPLAGGDDLMMAALLEDAVVQSGTPCPSCQTVLPAGTVVCVTCGYNLRTGTPVETDTKADKKGKRESGTPAESTAPGTASILLTTLIGAVIASAVGVAIWAGIAIKLEVESSWIAMVVGGIVGFGALAGARGHNDIITGSLAALMTIGAIVSGKYIAVSYSIDEFLSRPIDDEFAIDVCAGYIQEEAGETVRVRRRSFQTIPNMSWEEALDEARDYWRSLSQEERDEELAQLAAEAEALRENPDEIKSQILKESIEPIDWLFIGLGVFIAFGVGSGSEWLSSDD